MAEQNRFGIGTIGAVILAALIVILADIFIFPNTPGVTGFFRGAWDTRDLGIALIVIFVAVIALLFLISRGENRRRMLKEGVSRVWDPILRAIGRNKAASKIVIDYFEQRSSSLEGELPFELKYMRFEVYTLMNMMLRHEIHKAKSRTAAGLVHDFTSRENILSNRIPTAFEINRNMKKYIEGGEIKKIDPDGKWEVFKTSDGVGLGWARQYFFIYKIMEELRELLGRDLAAPPSDNPEDAAKKYLDEKQATIFASRLETIDINYRRYKGSADRFRVVNFFRAQRSYFIDMYNMMGVYQRGYAFASLKAKPIYCEYQIDPKSDNGYTRDIDWTTVRPVAVETRNVENIEAHSHTGSDLVELNLYNYSTSDINEIQVERKNLRYIRRYRKEDIVYLHKPYTPKDPPRFYQILDLNAKDWEFFVNDLEKGWYHPKSKRLSDYNELIAQNYFNWNSAIFKRDLTKQELAFDREALKNPGNFIYWGRKQYFDHDDISILEKPVNPYPQASLYGLWNFIVSVSMKKADDPELTRNYLDNYLRLDYRNIGKAGQAAPAAADHGGANHGH